MSETEQLHITKKDRADTKKLEKQRRPRQQESIRRGRKGRGGSCSSSRTNHQHMGKVPGRLRGYGKDRTTVS